MKADHWNRKRQQSAQEYIQLVYSKGISYYQKRLMKMGFINKRMLDLGCGPGQWAIAAGMCNRDVYGIDLSEILLKKAQSAKSELKITNVNFLRGSVENLPFSDNYFDLALCYVVLPYVHSKKKCIFEISRVLRKGCRVFLGTHGIGFYLGTAFRMLIEGNLLKMLLSVRVILNTLLNQNTNLGTNETFQTLGELKKLMNRAGLSIDRVFYEPCYSGLLKRKFCNLPVIISVIGTKL